jgi:hypothetical protein
MKAEPRPTKISQLPTATSDGRWFQRLVRLQFQETIVYQNSHLDNLLKTLKTLAVGFQSLSDALLHLQKWPKTLAYLDKNSLGSLKPLLVQWQEASCPNITWKEASEYFQLLGQTSYYDLVNLSDSLSLSPNRVLGCKVAGLIFAWI